jgi:phthalate 4,5-cis-dihydrodiol dehydrogenase
VKSGEIGLGVIGLGRGFTLTLPALKATAGIGLVAAFDPRTGAGEKFSSELGGRAYDSLDELLRDPIVDAVYVASPHELHASQTIAAAKARKHVLVEKPMATGIADCRAMVDAANAADVVLVVGPSHGFDPPVQRAADLISAGTYGRIRLVNALNFTDFVYRPRRPEELDPTRGGGVIYSQGAHQFDVVRRLVGQPITEITAIAGNWDPARPGAGSYTALMRFSGDAAATLTYSGYAHYDSDELMGWVSELGRVKDAAAYGETRRRLAGLSVQQEAKAKLARTFDGSPQASQPPPTHNEHFGFVLASCERADLKIMPDGIWIFGDERKEFLPVAAPPYSRLGVIEEFVQAIRGVRAARHDGEWGLTTTMCCEAVVRSSALGRPVSMNEADFLFANN